MSKRKLDDSSTTEDRSAKLAADVKGLNSAFASWVSSQSKDKLAFFWEKACQDYIAHVKSLKEEYADVLSAKKQHPEPTKAAAPLPASSSPTTSTTTTTTTTTFGVFSASGAASAPAASSAPAPAPTFSFGTSSTAQPAAGSTPPIFGVTSSSSGASAPSLSFSAAPATGFTGFSFTSSSAPSFAPAATAPAVGDQDGGEGGAEDAEEEGGEKFDSKVQKDETTTILFQANAKVHVKQGGSWEVRGTGSLTVRESKAAKRPFLLLSTDAGRALLTATVPKNCKPSVPPNEGANEKVRVRKLLVGMYVAPQDKDGGAAKLLPLMISVGGAEKRDELLRLLMQLGTKG